MIYFQHLMRECLVAIVVANLAICACDAAEYEVPQLPSTALPDTEVSTNISILAYCPGRHQTFSLRLQAGNCSSNEVLVAVGHDADGDGNLTFEETDFVFGCDCGERYLVDYAAQRVFEGVGDTICIKHRNFNPAWNVAKVIKRGGGDVGEVVTVTVETKAFSLILK